MVNGLRASAEETNARLNAVVAAAQSKLAANGGGGDAGNTGDQLSSLLQLDTDLRETRRGLGGLETSAFLVADTIRSLRRDISCCSSTAAEGNGVLPPSPRVFSSDAAKNDMLALCDDLDKGVNDLMAFLRDANGFWKQHDASLGERWDTLASLIKASQAVATLATGLEKLVDEVKSKPSEEAVKAISQETAGTVVGGAVGPMKTQLQYVEQDVLALKDSLSTSQNTMDALGLTQKDQGTTLKNIEQALGDQQDVSSALRNTVHDLAETVAELESRPVPVAGAPMQAPAPEPTVIICARDEVEESKGSSSSSGGPRRQKSPMSDETDGEGDADAGVFEDDGGGDAAEALDDGTAVSVIAGPYAGRAGTVSGKVVQDEGDDAITKYHIRLETSVYRPVRNRPASAVPNAEQEKALAALRDELNKIELKLKSMNKEKIDASAALKMILEAGQGNDKSRSNHGNLEDIEASIAQVTKDLEELRSRQQQELNRVKKELKGTLDAALAAAAEQQQEEEEDPATAVITTGQCLACGRLSTMHGGNSCVPGTYVGQTRPDSPNVLRGGFRLPVSIRPRSAMHIPSSSPSLPGGTQTVAHTYVPGQPGSPGFTVPLPYTTAASVFKGGESSELSLGDNVDGVRQQHQDPQQQQLVGDPSIPIFASARPKTSSGAFSASQRTSHRGAVAAGLHEVGTGVVIKAVRQLQQGITVVNDGYGALRPIRRAGLQGKKSLRAEVSYAPNRYSPQEFDSPSRPYYESATPPK
jgi:predicted  nucleic acid-binding Zn-ribbon protein